MYILKDGEFKKRGERLNKFIIFMSKVGRVVKELFPCLYYGTYEEEGEVFFGIYRSWFGYSFNELTFPLGYSVDDENEDYCEDENWDEEDNDGEDQTV